MLPHAHPISPSIRFTNTLRGGQTCAGRGSHPLCAASRKGRTTKKIKRQRGNPLPLTHRTLSHSRMPRLLLTILAVMTLSALVAGAASEEKVVRR